MANLQTIENVSGENQLTAEVRTFWNLNLIDELHDMLVVESFSQEEADIPLNSGQTMQFHKFAPLSAATTALTEGTDPAGSNLSITSVTVNPQEYGDYVKFSSRVLATSSDPLMFKTQMLQARQIALSRDSMLQTTILAGTNVTYAAGRSSRATVAAGDLPTTADLKGLIKNLRGRGVPYMTSFINPTTGVDTRVGRPAYVAMVNNDTWDVIQDLTGVVTTENYQSGNTLLPGEVGMYKELRFCLTTTGFKFAGAGASSIDVHSIVVVGAGAYGSAKVATRGPRAVIHPVNNPDSSDKLGRLAWAGWLMDFGRVILDDDKMERYEFAIA